MHCDRRGSGARAGADCDRTLPRRRCPRRRMGTVHLRAALRCDRSGPVSKDQGHRHRSSSLASGQGPEYRRPVDRGGLHMRVHLHDYATGDQVYGDRWRPRRRDRVHHRCYWRVRASHHRTAGSNGAGTPLRWAIAAFIFQKSLSHRQRRDRLKAEKDLYYIFFVLEAFPKWRGMIAEGLSGFASTHRAWFTRCRERFEVLFAGAAVCVRAYARPARDDGCWTQIGSAVECRRDAGERDVKTAP